MDEHTGLRATLREGPAGHWLSIPSPQVAERLALTDAAFVVIDTEHTSASVADVEDAVRAVEAAGDTTPVVRVAWNDHVRVKRVLDTGPAGVMAPQVNTVAEAEAFVAATRYPPAGRRGVAGARASAYGRDLDSYYAEGADRVATIAQVETREAVDNAGEISAVEGLDALLVGPADLSAALDCFGEYRAPEFLEAVEATLEASEVPVGTLATTPEEIDHWAEVGYDFQIVGVDVGYLAAGADAALARYRETDGEN